MMPEAISAEAADRFWQFVAFAFFPESGPAILRIGSKRQFAILRCKTRAL